MSNHPNVSSRALCPRPFMGGHGRRLRGKARAATSFSPTAKSSPSTRPNPLSKRCGARRPDRRRRHGRGDRPVYRRCDRSHRPRGESGHARLDRLPSPFHRHRQAKLSLDLTRQKLGRDRRHGRRSGPDSEARRPDHRPGLAPGKMDKVPEPNVQGFPVHTALSAVSPTIPSS